MRTTLICAVARNGVIGGGNQLLWRLKSDLRHFRNLTVGKPLVMGRKTYDSIGRPLPGRDTIVVTRDGSFAPSGVFVARSLTEAMTIAERQAAARGAGDVMIGGGGDIYAQTIGDADELRITEVDLAPDGDALFPDIDRAIWREASRESHPAGPDDEAAFSFVTYVRR